MPDRSASKCDNYSASIGMDTDRARTHKCKRNKWQLYCILMLRERTVWKRDSNIAHPVSATGLDPHGMVASADEVVRRTQASACWACNNVLSKTLLPELR